MQLNLNDPASIVAWFRVSPQRLGPLLRFWLTAPMFEPFRGAIAASRELVKGKP